MAGKCIFCGGDGPFSAVEHIVPPQLGRDLLVAPEGTVCDRCNNYFGANVDYYFYEEELGFMRAVLGLPTRSGHPAHRTGPGYHIEADKVLGHRLTIAHSDMPPLRVEVDESRRELRVSYTRSGPDKPWLTSAYLSKALVEFARWQETQTVVEMDKSAPVGIEPIFYQNARYPSRERFIPYAHKFNLALVDVVALGVPVFSGHVGFRLGLAGREFLISLTPDDPLEWAELLGYDVVRPSGS